MDIIFTFLSEYSPPIALLFVVAVATYFVTKYHISIQDTKKKVDELPCDAHGKKLDSHGRKLDKLDFKIDMVINTLDNAIRDDSFSKKKSPNSLTDAGEKFLVISGGKACIDLNIDFFISELEKINPQTAYDVEDNARFVLITNRDSPIFNEVKDYVYVAPKTVKIDDEDIDTSLTNVILAMGFYLRDKYLEKHPELVPV